MNHVGVLGSGIVSEVLANGLLRHGFAVKRGSREPAKLDKWLSGAGERASVGTFDDAASGADMIVLAVKGTAAESALELVNVNHLSGKIIIDTTNPIADRAPVNGVLQFFTGPNDSLMERLQVKFPEAKFVKAFSCVGNGFMVNPDFGGAKPTMFICGNDAPAKERVVALLDSFGWDHEDMGTVEAARAIEPLCMLWCIPGLRSGSWTHAFKLLRK